MLHTYPCQRRVGGSDQNVTRLRAADPFHAGPGLGRGAVAEGRVQPPPVVEHLHVLEHGRPCLRAGAEAGVVDVLLRQRGEDGQPSYRRLISCVRPGHDRHRSRDARRQLRARAARLKPGLVNGLLWQPSTLGQVDISERGSALFNCRYLCNRDIFIFTTSYQKLTQQLLLRLPFQVFDLDTTKY
jgi:hypothetical protein